MPAVLLATITPTASALVEISAMAESPRAPPLETRSSKIAHTTTTISVNTSGEAEILPHRPAIDARAPSERKPGSASAVTVPSETAMVNAPKPTCERPSPIME